MSKPFVPSPGIEMASPENMTKDRLTYPWDAGDTVFGIQIFTHHRNIFPSNILVQQSLNESLNLFSLFTDSTNTNSSN
jgi:hypothetical protein